MLNKFLDQVRNWRKSVDSHEAFGNRLRTSIVGMPWSLDQFKYQDGNLEFFGWALPYKGDIERIVFKVNDYVVKPTQQGVNREDIGSMYWFWPNSTYSGYQCVLEIDYENVFLDGIATVQYIDVATNQPFHRQHNYYFLDNKVNQEVPIPEPKRRKRVHGGTDENQFLTEGFTSYTKLQDVLQQFFSKNFGDYNHILDWGCGCGRVMRYLNGLTSTSVTGIDIDADNISWCQENLLFGNFQSVPLSPPTALASEQFDLIFGISVFTHLTPQMEVAWLAELARIASPGATLLMSVHSEQAICRIPHLTQPTYDQWMSDGFMDIGVNTDLDDVVEAEYYRNTYHTHEYINQLWTRWFDIVGIIPGYIGNYHDLVVMQKR
ncbi:MAG: class I SAM-dependent methyltransferase [Litorilinea sp.]